MAYKALYREWRPKTFDEVVGQKQVTITLKNQVKNSRIAHAYLLCGTRGTGKTSTAKILSKAVNCLEPQDGEPCNVCSMCKKINDGIAIDVTEVDAASHNGVDDIRNIIEDVKYPPQEAKHKVYIIDEVHMLSIGAVNAFLKTLEEPPNNVVFILATTDPQKLPITILSRCQRYDFKRIRNTDIYERLKEIIKDNSMEAEESAINFIARTCDGAMRDALSILDQVIAMSQGVIKYDDVIEMLGITTSTHLFETCECIIEKDIQKAVKVIEDIVYSGKDISLFIKELTTHMRNLLMVKVTEKPEEVLDMSLENISLVKEQSSKIRVEEIMRFINILQEAEDNIKWSKQGRIYLELAVIKMCKLEYDTSKEIMLSRINKLEKMLQGENLESLMKISNLPTKNTKQTTAKSIKSKVDKVTEVESIPSDVKLSETVTLDDIKRSWQDVLEGLKGKRLMSIYAYLKPGEPIKCEKGILTVKFSSMYKFSKNNLQKQEINKKVEDEFLKVLKEKIRIVYIVEENHSQEISIEDKIRESLGVDVEILDE